MVAIMFGNSGAAVGWCRSSVLNTVVPPESGWTNGSDNRRRALMQQCRQSWLQQALEVELICFEPVRDISVIGQAWRAIEVPLC